MIALRALAHAARARIVAPCDAPAVLGQQRDILGKRLFDVVDVAKEVEVILVDVQHDGDRRVEVQEARVEFARLDDEVMPAAAAGRAADEVQLAADVNRWVSSRREKRLREHRRRGRLAVRAGDANGERHALHQLADQVTALDLRNAQPRGLRTLGVVLGDGGGVDDHVRAAHVFRALADVDFDALRGERIGLVRPRAVRTADGKALARQQRRQPRHGTSANPDKVHAASAVRQYIFRHTQSSPTHRPTPRAQNFILHISYYKGKFSLSQANPHRQGRKTG